MLLLPLDLKRPNWSGFMQVAVSGGIYQESTIQVMLFINMDSTKLDIIYSALGFALDQVARQDPGPNGNQRLLALVTFDHPLFAKADNVILAHPLELDRSSVLVAFT